MMKLNTMVLVCVTASGLAGWATAQESAGTYAAPASAPAGAPRTGLYTAVTKGNAAADNTVEDFTRRPTLIGDKQYFAGFGDADLVSGAFSFQGKGLNWFGGMNGGADPDELRFGVGSGTAWGGGVILALDKNNVETAAGKTKTVIEGDGFGVFGDFNLGGSDVYGQVAVYTGFDGLVPPTDNYIKTEPAVGATTETTNSLINIMAGWKKDATTEGTHSFNAEVGYNLSRQEVDPAPTPEVDTKINELGAFFGYGYILKAASDYSVFLGCNGSLLWHKETWATAPTDRSHIGLAASPNLAFQKQLGKGFEAFSGASVTGSYDTFSDGPIGGPVADEASSLLTAGADVAVGMRWVLENFALEGSLKETLLQNGPYLIGGNAGQGMFFNVGMSLGI